MKKIFKMALPAAALMAVTAIAVPVKADTLANMERERALLIETLLDGEITPAERQVRIEAAQRRLLDLERMVLRDDKLVGRNTPQVRRAFANYDLTFLVHASAEKNRAIGDTWLSQLGISTQSLMSAKQGRR
ncbi:MAG: hypothetical protein HOK21_09730 [Rhodospirillaceae bacterium]|jgi:hypothetical protein|nr:hypothetical protein [Rhodospirillaceae bacterium]MBT4043236.1 hypothetical protein [Rhodospirillaceae bacterium]MBT4691409.1 hypothetical protein [Rhodospirillaceae bacterium]MBT5082912.1 hypothetical protein [Rhodospirillaceae bacterium]MBT5524356.1 hypothetical protein [Rhodospirillaceae bacterium]